MVCGDHPCDTAVVCRSARVASRIGEEFSTDDFYVILCPGSPADEFSARETGTGLSARGLRVLDYTDLLPGPAADHFYLPHDRHPRPSAHALVAARLVRDPVLPEVPETP